VRLEIHVQALTDGTKDRSQVVHAGVASRREHAMQAPARLGGQSRKLLEPDGRIDQVAQLTMKPPIPSLPTAQCFDHRPTVFMHALIESHREQLLSIARRRGVTNVRVFGSMVRGGEREGSDVDLLVTLAPGTSALALGGLYGCS
jgi:hypothetical protein